MSEPIIERLSRFTPDGTGLDRDALLFAAGRASARPGRRWMALASALAVSQLMTLVVLWPRPAAPVGVPFAQSETPARGDPAVPRDWQEAEEWTLLVQALATDGDLPPARPVVRLVTSDPPLRAFAALPRTLLD